MEIETKIFDVKKVRKVLKKRKMEPHRICDITDFFFDIKHFSSERWIYTLSKGKSGSLKLGNISLEMPDTEGLLLMEDFLENRYGKGSKIRLRLVDHVAYITLKWPKQTRKGVKSREEIETHIGSLSDMLHILLASGAILEKSIARVREIYHIPKYAHAELVIDTFVSAEDTLEYAELECSSEEMLHTILEKVFDIDSDSISDEGISGLHAKKVKQSLARRLNALAEVAKS